MKKVLALILFGALVTIAAIAQPHEEKARQRFEKMSEELQLTAEQKTKLQEIHDHYGVQIKALKEAEGDNSDEIRKLRKEKQTKVREVLNKEQLEKLDALQKEHKKKHHEMQKEIRKYRNEVVTPVLKVHGQEFDKLLTDEEKRVITELRVRQTEMKNQAREMKKMENSDQKASQKPGGRQEMMRKRNEKFRKDCKEQLKPIIEAHAADLKKVESNLEPQRIEWENQIKAIRKKYNGESNDGPGPGDERDQKLINKKKDQMKMRFLLLDHSAENQDIED